MVIVATKRSKELFDVETAVLTDAANNAGKWYRGGVLNVAE